MSATAPQTNGRPSLGDYIDVAERIAAFNAKYPDGSLQTIDWSVSEIEGRTFIVYRAAAYRTPEDQRPGMGVAWEPFPGRTPYTKDSELMNAETAAWGRAIVACGLTSNRKIASLQEVQARQNGGHSEGTETAPQSQPSTAPQTTAQPAQRSEPAATGAQKGAIFGRCNNAGLTENERKAVFQWVGGTAVLDRISKQNASGLIERLGEDGSGAQDILAEISAEADAGDPRAQAIASRYFEAPHGS